MSNPSTVWTQLSLPLTPVGSIPYVAQDTVTITTDTANFNYSDANATLSGSQLANQLTVTNGLRVNYSDTTATPGNVTINKVAGRVKIAAGQSGLLVTSNCCFANSIVLAQLETADATLKNIMTVPYNGSFTITGGVVATGAVTVSFVIINVKQESFDYGLYS